MSLVEEVDNLAISVGTELKKTRVLLNNNAEDLAALNTTAKGNLIAAINEVKLTADAAAGGGVAIDDDNVREDATYSSDKIVELDGVLQTAINGKPSIADGSTSSTSNTWSVSKIVSELANVDVDLTDLIDDETASTSTVYSSTETEARISAEVAALVGSAPETLDTLEEIATAIGNNEDALDGLVSSVGGKVSHAEAQTLDSTSQARARTNIGAASASGLSDLVTLVGTYTSGDFVTTFEDALD